MTVLANVLPQPPPPRKQETNNRQNKPPATPPPPPRLRSQEPATQTQTQHNKKSTTNHTGKGHPSPPDCRRHRRTKQSQTLHIAGLILEKLAELTNRVLVYPVGPNHVHEQGNNSSSDLEPVMRSLMRFSSSAICFIFNKLSGAS